MSSHGKGKSRPLFDAGLLSITKKATDVLHELRVMPSELILRHQYGDWGKLTEAGNLRNVIALSIGARIISVYEIRNRSIWVVTEGDRLTTKLFLAEETNIEKFLLRWEGLNHN